MTDSLGRRFAQAVAAKDAPGVLELLHPDVDFMAMTPSRIWEADTPEDIVGAIRIWFADDATIEELVAVDHDHFADRERVGYRLQVRRDGELHLVEQQAYLSERDGRIGWLRIMCAGYRRID